MRAQELDKREISDFMVVNLVFVEGSQMLLNLVLPCPFPYVI